ncbi:MAG: hypothetical protein AABY32_01410 [Nanoarchaeota archaeon]
MKEFRVSWEIDIDANSPYEAAKEAFKIMQEPGSSATFFEVTSPKGNKYQYDLEYGDDDNKDNYDENG